MVRYEFPTQFKSRRAILKVRADEAGRAALAGGLVHISWWQCNRVFALTDKRFDALGVKKSLLLA